MLGRTLYPIRDPLFRHPIARWCVIASVALLGSSWIAMLAIPVLPGSADIIVHYTTTFGIDALGQWSDLIRIPVTGTALLIVNVGLARFLAIDRTVAEPRTTVEGEGAHALAHAPALLMMATAILEFAGVVGSILLWRVNVNT